MRLLTTGDWQVEFSNLDKCETVVEEIISICEDKGIKDVVHLGDFKNNYNPVDVRVTNFGVHTCTTFRKKGIRFYINLGNHDRVGMYTDRQNWLPALQSAGAITYDEPGGYIIDPVEDNPNKKVWLQFLPFCSSIRKFRRYADGLVANLKGFPIERSLLFFHQDLLDCRYNVLGNFARSQSPLTYHDLHNERYLFCIGGHIHYMQRLARSNVWYAGSPFAEEWNEANQKKGYLIVDVGEQIVEPVWSKIPRMYDPTWPRFEESKPDSWKGALIRVHIPCDKTKDVQSLVLKSEAKYEAKYEGARVIAIPEFEEKEKEELLIKLDDTDKEKVKAYIKKTLPRELQEDGDKLCAYVEYQLQQVNSVSRQLQHIRFLRAYGKNFLSFREVRIDYNKQGLVLVVGMNRDWGNKSNGSGKTSLLQLLSVALEGRTFKNQRHNRWVRRGHHKGPAEVGAVFQLEDGRICKVVRARPHKLKFKFKKGDKWKDESSGNRPRITQEEIEETIGITWQTLSNAIYIDQQMVNSLLVGSDGERKELLDRIQNLERFQRAQELVKRDIKTCNEFIDSMKSSLDAIDSTLASEERHYKEYDSRGYDWYVAQVIKLKKLIKQTWSKKEAKSVVNKLAGCDIKIRQYETDIAICYGRIDELREKKEGLRRLGAKCTMCFQHVNRQIVRKQLKQATKSIIDEKLVVELHERKFERMVKQHKQFKSRLSEIEDKISRVDRAKYKLATVRDQLVQAKLVRDKEQACERRIKGLEKKRRTLVLGLKQARCELVFLEYCSDLLSKHGLPSYLNALMCAPLNKAAKFYSDLFADGEIKIKFEMVDGEFVPKVVNLHGGELVTDQSRGELRMASLITSFALRETSVNCNLLILDEPADGLDDVSARKFAKGLRALVPRFGTILLASHNPYIIGSIKPDHTLYVRKQYGMSKVLER